MGAGASTGESRAEKREQEANRIRCLRGVERFVVNVYATSTRVDSMSLILSSDMGRIAFGNFVKAERAEEIFSLYSDVSEILATNNRNITFNSEDSADRMIAKNISEEIERIAAQYIRPDVATQVFVSDLLRERFLELSRTEDKFSLNYFPTVYDICTKVQTETIFLMAREQFNRFILSKYYKTWRAAESSHAIAATAEDASVRLSVRQTQYGLKNKHDLKDDEGLSFRAFSNVDNSEISNLLGSESWLAALLAAVEGLPICFSLASARKPGKGYPIVYVNKYFEKVTGFQRTYVIGKGHNILNSPDTESDQSANLVDSMKAATPVQVIMIQRKFDGRPFKSLTCTKPVFDNKRKFLYVIAIHFDVSKELDLSDPSKGKRKLASDLMDMLPDTVVTDEEQVNMMCMPNKK